MIRRLLAVVAEAGSGTSLVTPHIIPDLGRSSRRPARASRNRLFAGHCPPPPSRLVRIPRAVLAVFGYTEPISGLASGFGKPPRRHVRAGGRLGVQFRGSGVIRRAAMRPSPMRPRASKIAPSASTEGRRAVNSRSALFPPSRRRSSPLELSVSLARVRVSGLRKKWRFPTGLQA